MDLLPERWVSNQFIYQNNNLVANIKYTTEPDPLDFWASIQVPFKKEDLKFENEFWDPL